jgi:hypothetical protein
MKSEAIILPEVLVAVTALPATLAWRANSGLLLSPDGRRRIRANIPGCADVIGVCRGRGIAIETKTLTGKQREEQENFQLRWERAGGLYIVARSVEDALQGLGRNER